MQAHFGRAADTPDEHIFNTDMCSARVLMEWSYNYFK